MKHSIGYIETVLDERANEMDMDLQDYLEYSEEYDPRHYSWFFEGVEDWGIGMTKSQIKEYNLMKESLIQNPS